MRIRHPEHVVLLLGFVLMITTAILQVLGFLFEKPQLLSWGRWACVAMLAVAATPMVGFMVGLVIEKLRGKRRD